MKNESRPIKSFLAGEDQPVSFAELFFDLVFVFSITQVVHLLHGSFNWLHIGQAILVFWLVWWAWTQFTWALNAADTKHNWVLFAIIVATAIAFFMAVSVPGAFSIHGWWFAVAYVVVRSIGLLIYLWVTWTNVGMRAAVRKFALVSVTGLLAVIAGGIIGGDAQYWFWGLTIIMDIIAASVGGRNEGWNLHPKHFAERHGLFVIIVLGETLIVAAGAAAEESWESELMIISALAVGITSCLWWLYFVRIKDVLEHALSDKNGADQSAMGRDVYSLYHFPMLCGLIIYAYAIEDAMLHQAAPLSLEGRVALASGIFLYSMGIVIAYWRARGKVLYTRTGLTFLIAGLCLGYSGIDVFKTLSIAFVGLLLLCALEERMEKV